MVRRHRQRRPVPRAGLLALCGFAVVWSSTAATHSSWTSGVLQNSTNSTSVSELSFVHDYPSSPNTCALVGPSTSTTCTGAIWSTAAASASAATKNDTITDNSAAPSGTNLYEQGKVESCAPVQLSNAKDSTNPLLPRYTVGFQVADPWSGTNAARFDGSQSYAGSAVSEESLPGTILSLGGSVAYGAWFKTTTTAGGPIFGFDTDPAAAGGTADKVLYMTTAGKLGFVFDTSGSKTSLSASAYNNGAWHFAYARIDVAIGVLGSVTSSATLYVDGASVGTGSNAVAGSGSGYFHVGWAPISGTPWGSGLSNYFSGSVSNAAVFLGASVPSAPASNPATQAAFDTFASGATDQYRLGDSGTTTFSSSIGYVTGGDPCAMDTLGWTLGGSAVFSATTLKTLATSGWLPATALPAPTPGNTQTSTTSYARAATYDADVAGLHLYAPVSYRVGLVSPPATGWSLTFTWSGDASGVFIA